MAILRIVWVTGRLLPSLGSANEAMGLGAQGCLVAARRGKLHFTSKALAAISSLVNGSSSGSPVIQAQPENHQRDGLESPLGAAKPAFHLASAP
jgi:hypothetical protein